MADERRKQYPFDKFEPKWQAIWEENKSFRALNPGDPGFDPAQPKFYVLDMFPYPSGTGLHVGHPVGYLATDILARYKRTRGFNVLHPMGWDAFGLPAEQYAIKTGQHPAITTAQNIGKFKGQLKRIGLGYDWEREINTTDPAYFKWTQWIFLKLYNSWFNPATNRAEPIATCTGSEPDHVRLAYVSEAPVNWCPALGTVLANEEVIDGKSEVGGFPVERRPMRQWMLRITAYCQRLIDELDGLDWPESIRQHQRNWIGRSEGAEVDFAIADCGSRIAESIRVFTTRPDTLFGATYMVLAPEHRLVDEISSEEQMPAIEEYRAKTARKSDLERTELAKEKTGVFTGGHAINPVNGERIPIWIADYVLLGYGTGAIMAVPAHDERDFEFAQKFHLPIRGVVSPEPRPADGGESPSSAEPLESFCGEGFAVNSANAEISLNGLPTAEAKKKITGWLESKGIGKRSVNFKLRDWLFSRQRYWGEPFPIMWRDGNHEALPESELPVVPPPMDDFKPTGTAEPPLSKLTDWIRYSDNATRETNTMPQWAGSCWYYLRFVDPQNSGRFVGEAAERYWMTGNADCGLRIAERKNLAADAANASKQNASSANAEPFRNPHSAIRNRPGGVDLYVGGTEHAVLHLLYARFWHKVLFDLGHISTPEPFQRLVNQGLMLGEDSQKMSKSRGNVVNPDDVIEQYGADALRCYEMFMGPLEATKPWSMTGVEGVYRFLARVWRLVMAEQQDGSWALSPAVADIGPTRAQERVTHATIKKVTADIEALGFNTAISAMMVMVNAFVNAEQKPVASLRVLLQLLNPFAPHLTEELWKVLSSRFPVPGNKDAAKTGHASLANVPWPEWDEALLEVDEVELPVQINGKLRDKIVVKKDAPAAEIEQAALAAPKAQEHLEGKTVRKIVVVPGKLVNIVAG